MWIEIQIVFGKSDYPEDFCRSSSDNPRQIGNTELGGCNRRPLEKITAFKFFCLVQHQAGKALSLEASSTITLRLTKVQNTYVFH